ncbi:MFS transporter [Parasphingopyxis algicola]|uniref:MFS transporter n=1 Tax=Parasphingopyxis algicola TaxID=2026624 RepID=UPI0015A0C0D5|nr:MFS transporter [Parasphingopyxis algicola]QLC23923.1 MFS transporter [Parasphingopyxis algicola]
MSDPPWPNKTIAWYTVGILLLAYALAYVDRLVVSLLVEPIKADLALSDTQIGLIVGLSFALFYSVMGLPIARYADGGNRKGVLLISASLWSAMTAICGFAAGFWTLFLARVGVAVGEAGIAPTSLSVISDNFPAEERSRPISIWVFGAALATVLAFGGGGLMLADGGPIDQLKTWLGIEMPSWRVLLILLGSMGIPLVLVLLTLREPLRRDHGDGPAKASAVQTLAFIREHRWMFAFFFGGTALCLLVLDGIFIWLPAYLIRSYGMSLSEAGTSIAAVSLVAGLAGTVGSGYLNDFLVRRGYNDGPVRATLLLALLGAIALPLAIVVDQTWSTVTLFGVGIAGLAGATTVPQIAMQQVVPNRMRAQIAAGYFFLVNIVGFGLGPFAIGATTDYIFGSEARVGDSMLVVTLVTMPIALLILTLACRPFRRLGFTYSPSAGTL